MFLSPLLLPRVSLLLTGVAGVSGQVTGVSAPVSWSLGVSADCIQMSLVASSLLMKLNTNISQYKLKLVPLILTY